MLSFATTRTTPARPRPTSPRNSAPPCASAAPATPWSSSSPTGTSPGWRPPCRRQGRSWCSSARPCWAAAAASSPWPWLRASGCPPCQWCCSVSARRCPAGRRSPRPCPAGASATSRCWTRPRPPPTPAGCGHTRCPWRRGGCSTGTGWAPRRCARRCCSCWWPSPCSTGWRRARRARWTRRTRWPGGCGSRRGCSARGAWRWWSGRRRGRPCAAAR
mmetsp:Transcript_3064/g.5056  ORF Transcript_3064/g.5056 Transcript_3064/m.5056 type:complete len:217 (+) Transcript_3064:86-736(+)